MATVDRKSKKYSDLDLFFQVHPYTRDVNKKYDVEAIKASVRNLILTKNYERPFHPEIGSQVTNLFFEDFSPALRMATERSIRDTIQKFEPRARLISINLIEKPDDNDITVEITFAPSNIDTPVTITQTLGRLR